MTDLKDRIEEYERIPNETGGIVVTITDAKKWQQVLRLTKELFKLGYVMADNETTEELKLLIDEIKTE